MTPPTGSWTRRLRLDSARTMWLGTGLSLLLLLPSLWGGLLLDDHVIDLLAREDSLVAGLTPRPLDLLTFTTGRTEDNRALIDEGALLPWWSHEQHLNALLRPLSTLTHRLDLLLWPDTPAAMHAQSLLWFALLLLCTWRLYAALGVGGPVGALAFLMFALDDVRGPTVAWIANRNAILAMLFGVLALLYHHRHRHGGGLRAGIVAWSSAALALASAESGLAIYAYLFAYAWQLDPRRGSLAPWLGLLPFGAIAVGWRILYKLCGYGTHGSDLYLDPSQQPALFMSALAHNLPAFAASQFGPSIPFADLMLWGPPSWRPALLIASLLVMLAVTITFAAMLPMDREQRFWALGMTLAAVLLSASAVGDRLLMPASLGASALLAHLGYALYRRIRAGSGRTGTRWMLGLVAANHLLLAPLLLPVRAASMSALGNAVDRADASIPSDPGVRDRTVVIINAPLDIVVSYLQIRRAQRGTPRPERLHWLATASSTLRVTRTGPRTLQIDKPLGWMYALPERHYRSRSMPLPRRASLSLGTTGIKILDTTEDGRPRQVEFTFREPLESPRYLFMAWRDGALVPWTLPKVGGARLFGSHHLFEILSPVRFGASQHDEWEFIHPETPAELARLPDGS